MYFIDEKITIWRRHYFDTDNVDFLLDKVKSKLPIEDADKTTYLKDTARIERRTINTASSKELYNSYFELLADDVNETGFNLNKIASIIYQRYHVTQKQVMTKSREPNVVEALRLVCYFADYYRIPVSITKTKILRNAQMVHYHLRVAKNLLQVDKDFKAEVKELHKIFNRQDIWKRASSNVSEDKKEPIKMGNHMCGCFSETGSMNPS